jgi:hypothetical protein
MSCPLRTSTRQLDTMSSCNALPGHHGDKSDNDSRLHGEELAHAPAVGGPVLRLVLALLTETELDPRLRELVIPASGPTLRWA